MSNDFTNLHILEDVHKMDFLDELSYSPDTLSLSQANDFFHIVLSHFKKDISSEIGHAILSVISRIICKEDFLTTFSMNRFTEMLPFDQKVYVDDIFDILYIIVTLSPISFDEHLSARFGSIIRRNPSKSLTLLASYSQHFNEIDNPWPMVDLLIHESRRFYGLETAASYASLLAYLCRKYSDYRVGRSEHCWHKIGSLLNEKDIHTLKSVYCSMFSITEVYPDLVSPVELMKPHLKIRELQDSVLTLLLAAPPVGKVTRDKGLLQSLLDLSETNKNATLVIMNIAADTIFAEFLVQNANLWMTRELPTIIDTMRLFFVVFRHTQLRSLITESPNFIEFLKMVTEQENSSTLSMICVIIRRIDLTEDLIGALGETGFLNGFFTSACRLGSNIAMHSALLMIDTLARVGYSREYLKMCDVISQTIMDRGELCEAAAKVAVRLCDYNKCIQVFKKKKLHDFMKKNLQNSKLRKSAQEFLDAIQDEV